MNKSIKKLNEEPGILAVHDRKEKKARKNETKAISRGEKEKTTEAPRDYGGKGEAEERREEARRQRGEEARRRREEEARRRRKEKCGKGRKKKKRKKAATKQAGRVIGATNRSGTQHSALSLLRQYINHKEKMSSSFHEMTAVLCEIISRMARFWRVHRTKNHKENDDNDDNDDDDDDKRCIACSACTSACLARGLSAAPSLLELGMEMSEQKNKPDLAH